jgi:hypothetical protein
VYSKSLEAKYSDLAYYSRHDGYSVESLDWDGLTARIKRQDTVNTHYHLLMLFASADITPQRQVQSHCSFI